MDVDVRFDAARFYDYNPNVPDDVPFYLARLPSPDCAVLELGVAPAESRWPWPTTAAPLSASTGQRL